jgi:uncharacterized protein YqgV (UPF0045/DUF77 family)
MAGEEQLRETLAELIQANSIWGVDPLSSQVDAVLEVIQEREAELRAALAYAAAVLEVDEDDLLAVVRADARRSS